MSAILALLTPSPGDGYSLSINSWPVIIIGLVLFAVLSLAFFATYSIKCIRCCNHTRLALALAQPVESEV